MKKLVPIEQVHDNEENPRIISEEKLQKLVKSIRDFPEMLEKRPIVVKTLKKDHYICLGGNQRRLACTKAGLKEVWIDTADDWTEEKQKEFIIKDNVSFGEWDWEMLEDWENDIEEWGLIIEPPEAEEETEKPENYIRKIEPPIYKPTTEEKPLIEDLFDLNKTKQLIKAIEKSELPDPEKEFLKIAAYRHTVFHYNRIAEYYSHSERDTQEFFEDSALVIIDFGKAIEQGFIELSEEIRQIYLEEKKTRPELEIEGV